MVKIRNFDLAGPLYLFWAFSLAGTSVIAAEFISGKVGTFTIAAVSLFLGLIGLLPFCFKQLILNIRSITLKNWLLLLVQAACGIFLFRMFLLQGLLRTSAGEAGILIGATSGITALLAWVILKESLNKKGFLGIICTVLGVLVINGILVSSSLFSIEHLIGNLMVFCAAISESAFNIISKISSLKNSLTQKDTLNPVIQTCLVTAMAFCLCLIPAFFEQPGSSLKQLGLKEWLSLAWYGLVVTALAFIFFYAGINRCRASIAAAFSGMMPLTALLLSVTLLGEQYGWRQWTGGILVILGIILTGERDKKDTESDGMLIQEEGEKDVGFTK